MVSVTTTDSSNSSESSKAAQAGDGAAAGAKESPRLFDARMPDGETSTLRLFAPTVGSSSASGESGDERPLVVIWPGFGVGNRYYDPIGRELAARGFHVASGELRGQGSSTAVASRKQTWGYHHVASEDYPETVRAAKKAFGLPADYPTVFLCHSMGGQIAALFMAREEADELNVLGFMGVGTGTPYFRGFEGKQHWRLRIGAWLIKGIITVCGYQPEGALDLSGYGRQAKGHLTEWIRYSQTNHLTDLMDADRDYEEAKKQVTKPILLTRFVNDEDCPVKSAENLAMSLPKADLEVEEFPKSKGLLGHNRWAREPEVVSTRLEHFIAEKF